MLLWTYTFSVMDVHQLQDITDLNKTLKCIYYEESERIFI